MGEEENRRDAMICSNCGAAIAPGLLNCPACRSLVHAERLKSLAREAKAAEGEGDWISALSRWRNSLDLLPPDSHQYKVIQNKTSELSRRVDSDSSATDPAGSSGDGGEKKTRGALARAAVGLGGAALLLWKFKAILAFLVTKGKILLLGLTKASTFFSMLLSFSLYWGVWGWKFALGLVVSIYVHEMGHVAALRKFGIRASAPAFIPGVGAVVRMKQSPANPLEDARVGLAGPFYGLGAALAFYLAFLASGWAGFAAIARVGAWINLFNLLPLFPLDGGRGFRPLSRKQRWLAAAAIGMMLLITSEGLLTLLLIAAVIYAFKKEEEKQSDDAALYQYICLVVVLSFMCLIEAPMGGD